MKLFFGNIRGARLSLKFFLWGPELLEKLEKGISVKKTWILEHFQGGPKGPKLFGGCLGCIKLPCKRKKIDTQK